MARRGYPAEFRKRVIELVEGGRKVAERLKAAVLKNVSTKATISQQ